MHSWFYIHVAGLVDYVYLVLVESFLLVSGEGSEVVFL